MTAEDDNEHTPCRIYPFKAHHSYLNAIRFSPTSTRIAMGWVSGDFKCYDFYKEKSIELRQRKIHNQRITTIDWYGNLIYTGSKDRRLPCIDSRTMKEAL